MILFILILAKGFSYVGQVLQKKSDYPLSTSFMIWALGASLFANAATMISVSYFDQSFLFLYLTLAVIGSAWSSEVPKYPAESNVSSDSQSRAESEMQTVAIK